MESQKKMKILCLHGFRTSGTFLKNQITTKWPSFASQFDMDFPDGIFPAAGKSDIEGIYPPPYYEWFQFDKDFTEYTNLEECITYLCDYITTKGPFDGLLGFSQGATLSGLLLGYQAQVYVSFSRSTGKVLKDHSPFKFCISISGAMFRDPSICDIAYKDPIKAKSVHFIGAKDWLRRPSEDFATAFDNPLIIRHPYGHTVPRLDEAVTGQLHGWTKTVIECNNTENGDATGKHNGTDLTSNNNTFDTKHDLENGEAKEKIIDTAPVIVESKIQNKEISTAVDIKTKERQVEVVEAIQA